MLRQALFIFASIVVFTAQPCSAQFKDSIKHALTYKPRLVFGLNSKVSTISGEPSRTLRLFGGLDYNKKMRFELGFNYMPQAAVEVDYKGVSDTILTTNQLAYWGVQAEYTFYRKNRWKLSYPVQLGWGLSKYTERLNQDLKESTTISIVPLEVGANAVYYFYDWIGIKGGMGIRMSFGRSFTTLSGPYYNLGIALYAGELYRILKEKKNSKT
jgi:hypothetical protein